MLEVPATLNHRLPQALPKTQEWEHHFHCADKTISTNLLFEFPGIFVLDRTMVLNGYQGEGNPYSLAMRSDDQDNITF